VGGWVGWLVGWLEFGMELAYNCPMAGFGTSGVEPLGSTTRDLAS
jgi:hypothetical protein